MSSTEWLPIIVACVAAVAAVLAALVSAYSAHSIKKAELQALKIQALESRVYERKYEVYRPIIDLLSKLIDPRTSASITNDQQWFNSEIAKFSTWIPIYGSDAAVVAFHNFMQAIFSPPPSAILMRLYGEFVIESRRDMGYSDTEVNIVHLLGLRINDVYDHELDKQLLMPFNELCAETGWTAPWRSEQQRL